MLLGLIGEQLSLLDFGIVDIEKNNNRKKSMEILRMQSAIDKNQSNRQSRIFSIGLD